MKGEDGMFQIGLTGGIASGKSTVVAMLRQLGAGIIDCDQIAHDVVRPGSEGLRAVADAVRRWHDGPGVYRPRRF